MRPYLVSTAQAADIDSITTLLQANSPSQGGTLTGEFSRDKVASMADGASPVIVARRAADGPVVARRAADGPVVGVLFSAAPAAAQAPLVLAMLAAYAGSGNAYVYGPVCIADSERGQGLLALLYSAMREQHAGKEAVLFIRRDNLGSLRAHERLGMYEVAAFDFDGAQFAVYSDAIVRE
ncbi:GNAT family N-acetyltransferase [Janthinobacterium lividum]|uniref:GNAT family N-acetyltransferase n=1 Tax=Janthinobacterium lividum TaxID=29581 RepID=UPI001595790A|nr:N-acetyltransferase [Janthinobacterium lividum]QKY09616.1 N-acetyltransferase [Janthinobacterium lividum]